MPSILRKTFSALFSLLFFSTIFLLINSCQKELTGVTGGPSSNTTIIPGDAATVTASVNGGVLDENNLPVVGAVVKCGTLNAVTDSMGFFYFKNVQVSKRNASVTILKQGYFRATRTFMAVQGKIHHVKIKLIPKNISGTINASVGGIINLSGAGSIQFPANAFAKPDGTVYTGSVSVYAAWINPAAPDLGLRIPGDLRGIRSDGSEAILESYGMIGAELLDPNGNELKLAANKEAVITFPIPATFSSGAPERIPLWHFNETLARWMKEGEAVKSGSNFSGRVNKFSFWNIDVPGTLIQLEVIFMNAQNNLPIANQLVKVSVPGTNLSAYGYTNCYGYTIGGVPVNQPILLEIQNLLCGSTVYSQNLGPFSANQNLDTIWVNSPLPASIVVSGKITNCSGLPVSDGYFSFFSPNTGGYIVEPDNDGNFSVQVFNCAGTAVEYLCKAVNNADHLQTAVVHGTTALQQLNLGNLQTCLTSIVPDVYVAGTEKNSTAVSVAKYWKNGMPFILTDGSRDASVNSIYVSASGDVYVSGSESDITGTFSFARLWKNGVVTVIGNGADESTPGSIFVNGSDVYMVFSEVSPSTGSNIIKLWKNGVITSLSDGTTDVYPVSVYVSGTDVYVLGYEVAANLSYIGKIWRNGVVQNVSTTVNSNWPTSLFISGTDVYVSGQEKIPGGHNKAVIWKNGNPQYLTDGINDDACVLDVHVDGSDIYACGRKSSTGAGEKAQFWKNGVLTVLSAPNVNSVARTIFVKNGDVYITENDFNLSNPDAIGRIWKNSLPSNISSGPYGSTAIDVFVQ